MSNELTSLEGSVLNFGFLVIDLVGHSGLVKSLAETDKEAFMDSFEKYVENHVGKNGGEIWSWRGDGGLAAFFVKDNSTIAVQNGIKCALALLDELDSFHDEVSRIIPHPVSIRLACHRGFVKFKADKGRIHSDDINLGNYSPCFLW